MEIRQVVFHSPGPKWEAELDFREQPGIMDHVKHYSQFLEQGKLFLGGPFIDVDAGGMMIATEEVDRDELEKFAASDPAVVNGLLLYEVKSWYVAMAQSK